jgi:hypothetical protein
VPTGSAASFLGSAPRSTTSIVRRLGDEPHRRRSVDMRAVSPTGAPIVVVLREVPSPPAVQGATPPAGCPEGAPAARRIHNATHRPSRANCPRSRAGRGHKVQYAVASYRRRASSCQRHFEEGRAHPTHVACAREEPLRTGMDHAQSRARRLRARTVRRGLGMAGRRGWLTPPDP